MIREIRLQNWKSHLDTTMNFGEGTNVIVGVMGSGKSIPYSEKVLVKRGKWRKVAIGEIVENALNNSKKVFDDSTGKIFSLENPDKMEVQSLNLKTLKMEPKKITGFIKHPTPPKMLKIKTQQGKEITVTHDHSLLCMGQAGEAHSVRGSDIKIGDFLFSPRNLEWFNEKKELEVKEYLSDFRNTTQIMNGLELMENGISSTNAALKVGSTAFTLSNWRDRSITMQKGFMIAKSLKQLMPQKIALSSEFGKLIGAFISEGHADFDEKKASYRISITNNDAIFIRETVNAWHNIFPNIKYSSINNDFQVDSKIASALFLRMFGGNAQEKKLPDDIYSWPEETVKALLRMYFEGDGWAVAEKTEIACSSKSEKLIDDLQTVLLGFGILSRIRTLKRKKGIYYELKIIPKYIPLFASKVGFLSQRKNEAVAKMVCLLSERTRWEGVDVLPNLKMAIKRMIHEYHLSARTAPAMRKLASQLRIYSLYQNMGREKLKRTLDIIYNNYKFKSESFATIENIFESHIFFDKVISIEEIENESEFVYDLSVDGNENFVAGRGNLIVHNSSVMDAVCFALYGTFPGLASRNVKLDEVITSKPHQADFASVVLKFGYNGKEYSVERRVNRKGANEAKLLEGGKLIGGPQPTDVTAKVEKIIEISYELFTRAVYSEQNQIDYFLKLSAAQRKEKFDELLNLNTYENVRANAVSLQNRLKKTVEDRKLLIKEQKAYGNEKSLSLMLEKLSGKQREIDGAKKQLEGVSDAVKEHQLRIDEAGKKEDEFRFYRELQIKTASRIEELGKSIKEAKKHLEKFSGDGIEELQKTAGALEKRIPEIAGEIRSLQERKGALEKSLGAGETVLMEVEKSLKGLDGADGVCPVCRRSLEKHTKKEIELENIRRREEANARMRTIISETGKIMDGIRALEKENLAVAAERERCIERMHEVRQVAEKEDAVRKNEAQVQELLHEAGKISDALKKIGFEEKEIIEIRRKAVEAEQKAKSLQREIKLHEDMLHDVKESIRKIEEEAKRLDGIEKQNEELSLKAEKMSVFVNALKATQGELRGELIGAVNDAMSDIWSRVYPYGDYVDARLFVDDAGNYDVVVREKNGRWVRAGSTLSGGERSVAALTLRISISLVLAQNLSWLILDEPTHNLDRNAVEVMGNIMKEHLPELVGQIFIITHDKEMERAASSTVYVLERDKEEESYTTVRQLDVV